MTRFVRIAVAAAVIGCLSGAGLSPSGATEEISCKDVDGTKIPVPPSDHPRVDPLLTDGEKQRCIRELRK
jgi:hypothetical protein